MKHNDRRSFDLARINNKHTYVDRLRRSIYDKMFFVDKIEQPDAMLDYGCSDGSLFAHIRPFYDRTVFFGLDKSVEMLEMMDVHDFINACEDHDHWRETKAMCGFKRPAIILSSIVHEVYHYSPEDVKDFWDFVFEFPVIIFRDMVPSTSAERDVNINDYRTVAARDGLPFIDYEDVWGCIRSQRDLLHYLLKRTFTDNWQRELRENYFPFELEVLLDEIIPDDRKITYMDHRVLPYKRRQWEQELGLRIDDATHLKMIIE